MPESKQGEFSSIPRIDIGEFMQSANGKAKVAKQIHQACCESGFFYVVGHGINIPLQKRLEQLSQDFFSRDEAFKMQIRMALGGRAWRGFFPVGGELTSGKPDLKEGIYFGAELDPKDPRVLAGIPLHGPNLFPAIQGFRETVLQYMQAVTKLGHALMRGFSLSLGLAEGFFQNRYTQDPLILFRIFHYPPDPSPAASENWGVGEHTDYGLLTILKQDDCGGLQVKSRSTWVDAPPVDNAFICNIGDMLDRMTGGLYRSTPHRVRNTSGRNRLSYPLFFDPGFATEIRPIFTHQVARDDHDERWDKASVHAFQGTYGDYLLGKVSKVFPDLKERVLNP